MTATHSQQDGTEANSGYRHRRRARNTAPVPKDFPSGNRRDHQSATPKPRFRNRRTPQWLRFV